MKYLHVLFAVVFLIGLTAVSKGEEKKGSPLKGMSKDDLVKLALSAAPAAIAKDATVMVPGEDGKMTEGKKGNNGFTCFPDVDGQDVPDPICADQAASQWINDLMSGAPKPTNTVPGISYMAKGGWHFEKGGKILMKPEEGAKRVSEPPHWMVFWPVDSKASGIPALPGKFGSYVMFEGTPYAHLMIYQNPNLLK
ncbi:MAG: hypothetical protein HY200_07070 [Nitrospirae bacterium]|nr:hypothetical protein [Nitrospirota bacterium]MBI3594705.1 hypothetical protein [Nitrospirota bacterium]